jgi:hypothetical protein
MTQTAGAYMPLINVNELNEFVRHKAQPMQAFAQAANPPTGKALGKEKGETVQLTFYPDVDDEGGELIENEKVPMTSITPVKTTYTVKEYGKSIPWTGKLEALARLSVEDDFMVALGNDLQKLQNRESHKEFDKTDLVASFNSGGDVLDTNGTASQACNELLTLDNLRFLVREAEKRNIPYWDGESYLLISGIDSIDNLVFDDDVKELLRYDSGRAVINGEIGRVGKARLIRDNHRIEKVKAGNALDKAYLCGADSVLHDVAEPPELRAQAEDFRRSLAVAYLMLGVWHKIFDQTDHGREHIIRVGSA